MKYKELIYKDKNYILLDLPLEDKNINWIKKYEKLFFGYVFIKDDSILGDMEENNVFFTENPYINPKEYPNDDIPFEMYYNALMDYGFGETVTFSDPKLFTLKTSISKIINSISVQTHTLPSIRNKITPIHNLISMLSMSEVTLNCENKELLELVNKELVNCKKSINTLIHSPIINDEYLPFYDIEI